MDSLRTLIVNDMAPFKDDVNVGEGVDVFDYWIRGMVEAKPGDVILYDERRPWPGHYAELLVRKGIGTNKFLSIRARGESGDSIIDLAMRDDQLIEKLRKMGRMRVSPYIHTKKVSVFAEMIGAEYAAPPDKVVDDMNNKLHFRNFATSLDLPITRGLPCEGKDTVLRMTRDFLCQGCRVVIKTKLNASYGNGMIRVRSFGDINENLEKGRKLHEILEALGNAKVLVEEDLVDSVPTSINGFIDDGGTPHVLVVSRQELDLNYGYMATVIGGHLTFEDRKEHRIIGKRLFDGLAALEYRGWAGFDLIKPRGGELTPVECNARKTAVTSINQVRRQRWKMGKGSRVTYGGAFHVPIGTTYEEAQEHVDAIPLGRNELVLLHNVRCLPSGRGMAIVQADNVKRASALVGALTGKICIPKGEMAIR